jgi:hypothetical protein
LLTDSRTAAYRLLPLTFHGLVVESTNRCNAKCAMCYQSSGPNGSDDWGAFRLSIGAIKRAIEEARSIPALHPRFHLAGGEAFIHARDCYELFSHARASGYLHVTTTSNCYWASTPDKARRVAAMLKESGLTQIEISWDCWHTPYIAPSCIDNAIRACSEKGIYVNLRILTTKAHGPREALSLIDPSALTCVSEISSGPVFPTGRAAKQLPKDDFHYGRNLSGACHSVLHLTINAKGHVYPCCAGADQTDALSFGSILREGICSIYEKMNGDPLLRVLVFYGVGALVPALDDPIDEEQYSNICHLCWDIFSSPARVAQVKNHFRALEGEQERLLRALLPRGD